MYTLVTLQMWHFDGLARKLTLAAEYRAGHYGLKALIALRALRAHLHHEMQSAGSRGGFFYGCNRLG